MSATELQNLEKNIERLKRQLATKRDTLTTIAPEEKERIRQQIEDLRENIREYETDYWRLMNDLAAGVEIPEAEALEIVTATITEVEAVTIEPPGDLSPLILGKLEEILATLRQPESPAAGKLKAALSALPPFVTVSYEAELDTERALRQYFPTFNRYLGGLKERLKK
ncbi:MAG: hypothetical protein ACK5CA_01875 [Cyanobacteriota bacterium]|jgi:HPt (histidine-containing phosphotransfer) domain-containing protein